MARIGLATVRKGVRKFSSNGPIYNSDKRPPSLLTTSSIFVIAWYSWKLWPIKLFLQILCNPKLCWKMQHSVMAKCSLSWSQNPCRDIRIHVQPCRHKIRYVCVNCTYVGECPAYMLSVPGTIHSCFTTANCKPLCGLWCSIFQCALDWRVDVQTVALTSRA